MYIISRWTYARYRSVHVRHILVNVGTYFILRGPCSTAARSLVMVGGDAFVRSLYYTRMMCNIVLINYIYRYTAIGYIWLQLCSYRRWRTKLHGFRRGEYPARLVVRSRTGRVLVVRLLPRLADVVQNDFLPRTADGKLRLRRSSLVASTICSCRYATLRYATLRHATLRFELVVAR